MAGMRAAKDADTATYARYGRVGPYVDHRSKNPGCSMRFDGGIWQPGLIGR